VAALFLAVACGGDSGGPPGLASGTYQYSSTISNLGVTCATTATTLTIQHSGNSLVGSWNGGTWTCTGPGGTTGGAFSSGPVVNGLVVGDTLVSFDFDNADWHNVGRIYPDSLAGIVNARYPGSGLPTVIAGRFLAVRQ
jgi:hypothetical protein